MASGPARPGQGPWNWPRHGGAPRPPGTERGSTTSARPLPGSACPGPAPVLLVTADRPGSRPRRTPVPEVPGLEHLLEGARRACAGLDATVGGRVSPQRACATRSRGPSEEMDVGGTAFDVEGPERSRGGEIVEAARIRNPAAVRRSWPETSGEGRPPRRAPAPSGSSLPEPRERPRCGRAPPDRKPGPAPLAPDQASPSARYWSSDPLGEGTAPRGCVRRRGVARGRCGCGGDGKHLGRPPGRRRRQPNRTADEAVPRFGPSRSRRAGRGCLERLCGGGDQLGDGSSRQTTSGRACGLESIAGQHLPGEARKRDAASRRLLGEAGRGRSPVEHPRRQLEPGRGRRQSHGGRLEAVFRPPRATRQEVAPSPG
jgi:hypothetical protein